MEKHMDKLWEAGEVGEVNMKLMHVGKNSPWGDMMEVYKTQRGLERMDRD